MIHSRIITVKKEEEKNMVGQDRENSMNTGRDSGINCERN